MIMASLEINHLRDWQQLCGTEGLAEFTHRDTLERNGVYEVIMYIGDHEALEEKITHLSQPMQDALLKLNSREFSFVNIYMLTGDELKE